MKKIVLVLLFAFSVFADNSDKRNTTINTENIKRIDITRGADNSAWRSYQDSNYSVRDKVIEEYKIKPKNNLLTFLFSYRPSTVDDTKAKELHIQAYYITHITVSTDKRLLLDASMSDLNRRHGGIIGLQLSNDHEKTLTIRITDSNNYTTEHYVNISSYTCNQNRHPLIVNQLKNRGIIDYRRQYPQAWEATNIARAVEALYGKDMAKKVQERYRDVNKESFQCSSDAGVGVSVDTTSNEQLSSLAIFSTTTNKKRSLVSIVDVLNLNVSVPKFASFIAIPVSQDGEIMVIGKDREGILHMSQLIHCKAVNSAEEVTPLIFKLD